MTILKGKIKRTALFTQEEKVEILAAIDTFSKHDVDELESIIDEYDRKYKKIVTTFRQNMFDELDRIQKQTSPENLEHMKKAIEKIKSGLSVVTST